MSSKFLHLIHILGSWASQVGTYQWVSYSLLKNVKQVPIIFAVHPWNPAYVPLLGSGIVIQKPGHHDGNQWSQDDHRLYRDMEFTDGES